MIQPLCLSESIVNIQQYPRKQTSATLPIKRPFVSIRVFAMRSIRELLTAYLFAYVLVYLPSCLFIYMFAPDCCCCSLTTSDTLAINLFH